MVSEGRKEVGPKESDCWYGWWWWCYDQDRKSELGIEALRKED